MSGIRPHFASDNTAPVAPEIMAAILAANHGPASSYGADELTARLDRACPRGVRDRPHDLPGLDRHRRQRPGPVGGQPALRRDLLPRDRAHPARGVRRARVLHRRRQADRPARRRRQARRQRVAAALACAAEAGRAPRGPGRDQPHPGDRVGHGLSARGGRGAGRARPRTACACIWTAPGWPTPSPASAARRPPPLGAPASTCCPWAPPRTVPWRPKRCWCSTRPWPRAGRARASAPATSSPRCASSAPSWSPCSSTAAGWRYAAHANAMAGRLAAGLQALPGLELVQPVEANELFVAMPEP